MKDSAPLSWQVVRELKSEILSGKLSPGARLPAERELSEKYHVSRGTVRTAISRLSQLGFVKTIPQSGTFVADYLKEASIDLLVDIMTNEKEIDTDFLIAMLDLRRIIEVHYTRRAVLRMNEADIRALKDLAVELGKASFDVGALVDNVYRFHARIIELSGNPLLRFLANSFEVVHRYYLNFFFQIPGNAASMKPFYEKLYRAVETGDDHYAAFVMGELLEHAEVSAKNSLDSRHLERSEKP